MGKKPAVLMILDGYGLNEKTEGNAPLSREMRAVWRSAFRTARWEIPRSGI